MTHQLRCAASERKPRRGGTSIAVLRRSRCRCVKLCRLGGCNQANEDLCAPLVPVCDCALVHSWAEDGSQGISAGQAAARCNANNVCESYGVDTQPCGDSLACGEEFHCEVTLYGTPSASPYAACAQTAFGCKDCACLAASGSIGVNCQCADDDGDITVTCSYP